MPTKLAVAAGAAIAAGAFALLGHRLDEAAEQLRAIGAVAGARQMPPPPATSSRTAAPVALRDEAAERATGGEANMLPEPSSSPADGGATALPLVEHALSDGDPDVRAEASAVLGLHLAEQAAPAIDREASEP